MIAGYADNDHRAAKMFHAAHLPENFFENLYQGRVPWDIGRPQPELLQLLAEFEPAGPLLDIGCGTGDHAIAFAAMGHAVTGIDSSGTAIIRCNDKKAALGPKLAGLLDFLVADAFDLRALDRQFGSIVDSGFYHLFDPGDRNRLADEVAKVLPKGGRYYLLGFSVASDQPYAPKQVTLDEIGKRFTGAKGWRVLAARAAEFVTLSPRGNMPAVAACVERL